MGITFLLNVRKVRTKPYTLCSWKKSLSFKQFYQTPYRLNHYWSIFYLKKKHLRQTVRCPLAHKSLNRKMKTKSSQQIKVLNCNPYTVSWNTSIFFFYLIFLLKMWNTGIGLWHLVQDIESKVFIKIKRVTALSFLEKWQYSTQTWRIEQSHIHYAHGKSISSNNFIKHLTGLIIIGVFFIFYTKEKHLRGKLWDVHWQMFGSSV